MGSRHQIVDSEVADEILDSRRRRAQSVTHRPYEVELVDCATPTNEVAEMGGGLGYEAREHFRNVSSLPSAPACEPCRSREMVESDDRSNACFAASRAHPAVMVERGDRELALRRFDPAPLQRKPIGTKAHGSHELNVLGPAME